MAEGDAADTVAYAAPAQMCPEKNARFHLGDGFANGPPQAYGLEPIGRTMGTQ